MIRFLVDAQLPPALARWLDLKGYPAEHVSSIEMMAATDSAIWTVAIETGAVIVTKDEDFAIRRNLATDSTPAVVWIRIGNTRKAELLRWMETILPTIVKALENGETLVEVT